MRANSVMMADESGKGVNWPCCETFTKLFEFFNEFYFFIGADLHKTNC